MTQEAANDIVADVWRDGYADALSEPTYTTQAWGGNFPTVPQWADQIRQTVWHPDDSFEAGRDRAAEGMPAQQVYWSNMYNGWGMMVLYDPDSPLHGGEVLIVHRSQFTSLAEQVGVRTTDPQPPAACLATPNSNHTSKRASNRNPQCSALIDAKPVATPNGTYAITRDHQLTVKNQGVWAYPKNSNDTRITAIAKDQTANSNKIFARTIDNHLYYRNGDSDDWHNLGSDIVTDPTVETHTLPNGTTEEWAWGVSSDGTPWERNTKDGSSWIAMPKLSGGRKIVGNISPVANPGNRNRRYAYARDDQGHLRELMTTNAGETWHWNDLGNAGTALASSPTAVNTTPSKGSPVLWIDAIDKNGNLSEYYYNWGSTETNWRDRGNNGSPLKKMTPSLIGISSGTGTGRHISFEPHVSGSVSQLMGNDGDDTWWYTKSSPGEDSIVSPMDASQYAVGAGYTHYAYGIDNKGNLQTEGIDEGHGIASWTNEGHI
ncbi:hypothetical protein ACIGW8_08935 [Streptomyces sioyaensis]|uniref:hypothetical protein n=1 Tax=Streptomyces sioyaensis TaxID=67364 RepID=UPI0037D32654